MKFASFAEFLHMGGYASFVWGSYAVALVVLVAAAIQPLLRRRVLERELLAQFKREERARTAAAEVGHAS